MHTSATEFLHPPQNRDAINVVRTVCRLLLQLRPDNPLKVRTAATLLACSPSKAHRLLQALCEHGFARQNTQKQYLAAPPGGAYSLPLTQEKPVLISVHRALTLLRALQQGNNFTVKNVAAMFQISPSSAHRLLNSLKLEGLALQLSDRSYRASPALVPADSRLDTGDLLQIIQPVARDISVETGDTIHLWMLSGAFVRLIQGVEGTAIDAIPHNKWPVVPAYSTAGGRTMLARLPNPLVEGIYKEGLPPWRSSNIQNVGSLKKRLSTVRKQGYDTNLEEGAQGVSGLAISVKNQFERPVFALGLALPSRRFNHSTRTSYINILEESRIHIETALR